MQRLSTKTTESPGDLRRPRMLSSITVHGADQNGDRDAAAVRLVLDDGHPITKRLDAGGRREAEVDNLHAPRPRDHDVLGFQIAVDYSACVRKGYSLAYLLKDPQHIGQRSRTAGELIESRALHELTFVLE